MEALLKLAAKLLLISIMVATVAIPILAARDRSAVRGMKRALVAMLIFSIAYAVLLVKVQGSLPPPQLK